MQATGKRDSTRSEAPGSTAHAWFEECIEGLLPRLMGTALRFTRDRTDAEDLVADTLATAWSKLDTLEDRDALGPWLCRILTNTFISQRRSAASKAETELYVESDSESPEGFSLFERLHQPFLLWQSNPEKQFLDRLLREDLEAAIDSLPEAFRLAVILVDVQGVSYQEAAESLGLPVGTVRSKLARGRSRLQEALWNQAVDAGFRKRPGTRPSGRGEDHEPTEPDIRLELDRGDEDRD